MKKSGILNSLNKTIKNLLPGKGDSLLGVVLKVIAIFSLLTFILFLLPLVLTLIIFFLIKNIEFENKKFKTYTLIGVSILGIFLSAIYWKNVFVDKEFEDNLPQVTRNEGESVQNEQKEDITALLENAKDLISDFNENLEIASNYKIDLTEYEDINEFGIDKESSVSEIEKVLGIVKGYNQTLKDSIKEAAEKTYQVTEVVDGDTIKIQYEGTEESVRLIGIDTPETKDPSKPVECFGEEASKELEKLVSGKKVKVMFDSSQGFVDKYGRLLLYIWVDDIFVNKEMIEEGYAYEYTYSTPYLYQSEFKKAQNAAKSLRRGLWGDVCACNKEEINRKCSSCRKAVVTYQRWDCSTYTDTVSDSSCTNGCTVYKPPTTQPTYTCNCSKTCTQIASCAEAYYQLNTCGCSKRDGDKDGVPCESLCN